MKTYDQLVTCAKRELALRRSHYPRWVREGRMTQDTADHEIECMEHILKQLTTWKILNEAVNEIKATYPDPF